MTISLRPAFERGETRTDWLESWHSFSFGHYRDPRHMGFRRLRVINDDVIAAGGGFGMHPHQDMEILTFMDRGALVHRDSMGNGSRIEPGDVQRMTAGTGVLHSEENPSQSESTRLLQVWIEPATRGLTPSYEQRSFGDGWQLVASRDGRDGSLLVHQDVDVYRARLEAGDARTFELAEGRHAWLQVVGGDVELGGHRLGEGDGAAVSGESKLDITTHSDSHYLLFDLA